jgi:carbon storage regulator CsrA
LVTDAQVFIFEYAPPAGSKVLHPVYALRGCLRNTGTGTVPAAGGSSLFFKEDPSMLSRNRFRQINNLKSGLVLSRKVGEQQTMQLPHGGEIVVSVLGVDGQTVRFHTAAPRDVKILRTELDHHRTQPDSAA